MATGIYTLLIGFTRPATVPVGSLGRLTFDAGWYAYTGSARGPGGFSRIERHRAIALGDNNTRHWHIDYLLGHSHAAISAVERSPTGAECAVAQQIDGVPVPAFGASDCTCASHLAYSSDRGTLRSSIQAAHDVARLSRE